MVVKMRKAVHDNEKSIKLSPYSISSGDNMSTEQAKNASLVFQSSKLVSTIIITPFALHNMALAVYF